MTAEHDDWLKRYLLAWEGHSLSPFPQIPGQWFGQVEEQFLREVGLPSGPHFTFDGTCQSLSFEGSDYLAFGRLGPFFLCVRQSDRSIWIVRPPSFGVVYCNSGIIEFAKCLTYLRRDGTDHSGRTVAEVMAHHRGEILSRDGSALELGSYWEGRLQDIEEWEEEERSG